MTGPGKQTGGRADVEAILTAVNARERLAEMHANHAQVVRLHPDTRAGTGPDTTGSTGPEGAGRRVILTPASAIPMRAARWTWDERIPAGTITLIPGREGIGKSLTLAWLAAQITRGVLPGCHLGMPRAVIYAATEDSWSHTIGPRLYAAGADMDRVYRVDIETDGMIGQLTLPVDCAALAEEITRLEVAMLAADPLLSLINSGIDTHRDRDLRRALEPLARMADATGCAVVGLAHFNKSASPDALNLITGSRAFSAVARAVIAIARDDEAGDGSCVMSQAKSNLGRLDLPSLRYVIESVLIDTQDGPTQVGRLVITGESERSVADILGEGGGDGESREERGEAAGWLGDFLANAGGEASWDDLRAAARKAGISDRTLRRARSRAGATTERRGFQGGSIWRLILDHPAQPAGPIAAIRSIPATVPRPGRNGTNEAAMAAMTEPGHTASPATAAEGDPR